MIVLNILYVIIQWLILLIIRIPLMLLGLIIVPLGLLFKKEHPSTIQPFSQHNTHKKWIFTELPRWLWLWSNDRDGALGDKRGWWDKNCSSGNARDFSSMFHWMAIRNPVNNMRFVRGISCNAKESVISVLLGQETVNDKVGQTGFQFLKAKGPTFNYYHLYWVKPNKDDPTKAFIIRCGHKVKVSHNTNDWSLEDANKVWKGFTFRIGFNKDIS